VVSDLGTNWRIISWVSHTRKERKGKEGEGAFLAIRLDEMICRDKKLGLLLYLFVDVLEEIVQQVSSPQDRLTR